jgi:hypothetical protein
LESALFSTPESEAPERDAITITAPSSTMRKRQEFFRKLREWERVGRHTQDELPRVGKSGAKFKPHPNAPKAAAVEAQIVELLRV